MQHHHGLRYSKSSEQMKVKRKGAAMNKTMEGLKENTKEIFDMERKLDKLYEQRREIINYLGLNKKPQE